MRTLLLAVSLLVVSRLPILSAADTSLSAPSVGYSIAADSRTVRLIRGVPGATHYSEAFALPAGIASVRATPGHRWLLAWRSEGAASVWIPESEVWRPLANVAPEPWLIAFSPSGSAAVFAWPGRLVAYRGLPEAPVLAADSSDERWNAGWTALAIDDAARQLVGMTPAGELHLLLENGQPAGRLIREARSVSSFAFVGGDTLAAVDSGGDRVEMITPASRRVIQLAVPLSATTAIARGGEGWFLLADLAAPAIHRIDLAGAVRTLAVDGVAVSGIELLRPRGTLLLCAPAGTARRIVSSHEGGEDLFFLPSLAVDSKEVEP